MTDVRLSVVVPTYQRAELLARCLYALTLQDFPGVTYEIIVVSDGPDSVTNATMARFLRKTTCSIRYHSLSRNSGPAAARNAGWRMASGELIAFTDDDCVPSVTWLWNLWQAYRNYASPIAAFSGTTIVPIPMNPTDYELNISRLADAEFITANCACTRKALLCTDGFDERFSMAWREDSDLQFKFIEQGISIIDVPSAVVTHPVRKAVWGASISDQKKSMFNALLYKKFPALYRKRIKSQPSWLYYGIASSLLAAVFGGISGRQTIAIIGLSFWIVLTAWFCWHRLRLTSRRWSHVAEMILTSAVVPVLSLYWNIYGAWKFRVFRVP